MNKASRVLMVLPGGAIGGAERVLFNLTECLLRNGIHVAVYVMSKGSHTAWSHFAGEKGYQLTVNSANSERRGLYGLLKFIVSEKNFDYVLSSHAHLNGLLSFLRRVRLLDCNFLVSRESTLIFNRFRGVKRFLFWVLYKFFYGKQDLLIFQTQEMLVSLNQALKKLPVSNCAVLQNPVNSNFIERQLLDQKPIIDFDGRLIVAAGRLIELKGFRNLISCFLDISKKYPETRLIILGDGPLHSELEELIFSLRLSEKVNLVGKVDNPYIWFSMADIGVCSSRIEGFPNVLIEMMASGVDHIVSTPCTEAVTKLPGVTISESWDSNHLFEALDSALSKSGSQSQSYKRFVEEKCSVSEYWESIVKLSEGV